MAQIRSITREALEAFIRNNSPSQNGFTEDLQASNVIQPVLNITDAAEGTTTPQYLQTALAFGSQTTFEVSNTTSTIANTPGFWRVTGVICATDNLSNVASGFRMTDGLTTKQVYAHFGTGNAVDSVAVAFDLTFFLAAGISLVAFSEHNGDYVVGSLRQVADVNGNLINPSGFTPQ